MATNLLPIGTTAAASAWQVLGAGEMVKLFLVTTSDVLTTQMRVDVQFKGSDGLGKTVGELTADRMRSTDIYGPIEYRVSRPSLPAGSACGVDQS